MHLSHNKDSIHSSVQEKSKSKEQKGTKGTYGGEDVLEDAHGGRRLKASESSSDSTGSPRANNARRGGRRGRRGSCEGMPSKQEIERSIEALANKCRLDWQQSQQRLSVPGLWRHPRRSEKEVLVESRAPCSEPRPPCARRHAEISGRRRRGDSVVFDERETRRRRKIRGQRRPPRVPCCVKKKERRQNKECVACF